MNVVMAELRKILDEAPNQPVLIGSKLVNLASDDLSERQLADVARYVVARVRAVVAK